MILVNFYKDVNNNYKGFESIGHASFAEHGQDIVCAAVSALVINTFNSIEEFTQDDFQVDQHENAGWLKVKFNNTLCNSSILLLDSLKLGLMGIEEEYGREYIEISIKEV